VSGKKRASGGRGEWTLLILLEIVFSIKPRGLLGERRTGTGGQENGEGDVSGGNGLLKAFRKGDRGAREGIKFRRDAVVGVELGGPGSSKNERERGEGRNLKGGWDV